jgi:hypothetical protein
MRLLIKSDKTVNVRIRNTEAPLCNHCYSEKAVSITYSECVCSLKYPKCNAHAPYRHPWPGRLCSIFPFVNCTVFGEKKIIERKICVQIFSTTFV